MIVTVLNRGVVQREKVIIVGHLIKVRTGGSQYKLVAIPVRLLVEAQKGLILGRHCAAWV